MVFLQAGKAADMPDHEWGYLFRLRRLEPRNETLSRRRKTKDTRYYNYLRVDAKRNLLLRRQGRNSIQQSLVADRLRQMETIFTNECNSSDEKPARLLRKYRLRDPKAAQRLSVSCPSSHNVVPPTTIASANPITMSTFPPLDLDAAPLCANVQSGCPGTPSTTTHPQPAVLVHWP